MNNFIKKIDTFLPQTQCQKCGYKDCKTYANAISRGAKHDLCTTGGQKVSNLLANFLKLSEQTNQSLNDKPTIKYHTKAFINEDLCIGCNKCSVICPIDAIVGTKQMMHIVLKNECNGCELCINVCPMDCIHMVYDNNLEKEPKSLVVQEKKKNYYRDLYNNKTRRKFIKLKKENKKHLVFKHIDKKAYINKILINFKKLKKVKD